MNEKLKKEHENCKEKQRKEIEKKERELLIAYALLFREIKKEIREVEERAGEFDFDELNKHNRLNKAIDKIDKKIDKNRNKEIAFTTALLALGYQNIYKDNNKLFKLNAKIPDVKDIKEKLDVPWSGLSYKERIWDNQHRFKRKIKQELVQGAINKDNANKVIKNVEKEIKKNYNTSKRLIDTEYTRANYIAETEMFKEEKIEKVMYNATFDNTCDECSGLDGNIYILGSEPALPRHTHCACFYTPIIP